MAGASFADYSDAFSKTTKHSTVIPASALKEDEKVQIRAGSAQPGESVKNQYRNIGNIMQQVAGFTIMSCTCGLKMKIPPNYTAAQVQCPRCGQVLPIS
jgi:heat shock protein HtpX